MLVLFRHSSCVCLGQELYFSVSMFVLAKLIPKFNDIGFVCLCSYVSQLPFSAYASKGIQFAKVYRLSSESLLYKSVSIYLNVCNLLLCVCIFTKKIKFKPSVDVIITDGSALVNATPT